MSDRRKRGRPERNFMDELKENMQRAGVVEEVRFSVHANQPHTIISFVSFLNISWFL